jgi:anti-sigma B factor antagonist
VDPSECEVARYARNPEPRQPHALVSLIELGELDMSSQRDGATHTICLFGELDLATAGDVERELKRVEATDARSIVLDLSGLTFIDSTGLHLILKADVRSRADSCRLTLLRGPKRVQRVFVLSGIERQLPFVDRRSA